MAARSKARKRALDVLYASDLRAENPVDALERAIADGEGPGNDYTTTLVRGVVEHQARIDELLATYAQGWTLERMPAVDRALLRMGTFELLHCEVPVGVVISEAVELASEFSTDDSSRFVNGVLSAIARER